MNSYRSGLAFDTSATTGKPFPVGLTVSSPTAWGGSGFVHPPPLCLFYQRETPELLEFVSNMTSKGVIKRCKALRFQGDFLAEKRDSLKRRVILDLSHLNLFIRCDKFKMTTVVQVRTLLPHGTFTCSIDLSDVLWLAHMGQQSQALP